MCPRQYRLGKRQAEIQATRDAIVRAAKELFQESGYHRTSIEDVARRANVAPATIYYQFGTKPGLLDGVLASLFDIDLEPTSDDAATDEPLLISRKELIEVGVPTSRIHRWLSTDLLLATDRRGVYELTPEVWVHLEPMFEV